MAALLWLHLHLLLCCLLLLPGPMQGSLLPALATSPLDTRACPLHLRPVASTQPNQGAAQPAHSSMRVRVCMSHSCWLLLVFQAHCRAWNNPCNQNTHPTHLLVFILEPRALPQHTPSSIQLIVKRQVYLVVLSAVAACCCSCWLHCETDHTAQQQQQNQLEAFH